MGDFASQIGDLASTAFIEGARRSWLRKSRILVLVDGPIQVLRDPAPTPENPDPLPDKSLFNISIAIATIRNFAAGFSSFDVTVATRNGLPDTGPGFDKTAFRFSDAELANYDQVWMFGSLPDDDRLDDASNEAPGLNPLSDAELARLARWMDAGGGVFAAGDHENMGATMCSRVLRVSTMRAWKIADDPPFEYASRRFQTTRPARLFERLGVVTIKFDNELDAKPQAIEWVPYSYWAGAAQPHPMLSHPSLGAIDAMPDHMHEGRCFDPEDPVWLNRYRDLSASFGDYTGPHFPATKVARPLPSVVAWGRTPASPPLRYEEGPQAGRRFPNIVAYDGQQIGIGRVVVQSTWHHWFDMNLRGMIAAKQMGGPHDALDRILRYYSNVGIYLASRDWRLGMLLGWLKARQFAFFGRQAISLRRPDEDIGRITRSHIDGDVGSAWVAHILSDEILDALPAVGKLLAERSLEPVHPSALAREAVLDRALGALVRAVYADTDELRLQLTGQGQLQSTPLFRSIERRARTAIVSGAKAAVKAHRDAIRREEKLLSDVAAQR